MQLRANHPARAGRYRNTAGTPLTRRRRSGEERYLRAPGYGERSVK